MQLFEVCKELAALGKMRAEIAEDLNEKCFIDRIQWFFDDRDFLNDYLNKKIKEASDYYKSVLAGGVVCSIFNVYINYIYRFLIL